MKLLFSIAVLLVINLINCEDIKEEEGVLVLTKSNFKDALKNEFVLVEFCKYWHFINYCVSSLPLSFLIDPKNVAWYIVLVIEIYSLTNKKSVKLTWLN